MSYLEIPKVLLPNKSIDLEKWSVIACDQFTSQVEYWIGLAEYVKNSYSTLNLIFPEVYLDKIDNKAKVDLINSTMQLYLDKGIFNEYNGFIYVEREITPGVYRKGLMVCVDLEAYDYNPKAKLPIRATERTVKERLPIRIEIRKEAPLELPHICIFMDDAKNKVFNKLEDNKDKYEKLYDFYLNMNGGHIKGYLVNNSEDIKKDILSLVENRDDKLLFVVGDGNHSLASAKESWNLKKQSLTEEEIKTHPARFALCELQNVHDEAIIFEPIHRFIIGADEDCIDYLKKNLKGNGKIQVVYKGKLEDIAVNEDPTIAIADIQSVLDDYVSANPNIKIDYIHGDNYLLDIEMKQKGVGIFMPKIDKATLFDYVRKYGVMPRKSFSMGNAESKRYYLEAHKI